MRCLSWVVATFIVTGEGAAQERFSFFHPSTPETVERMLRLADLRDDDVVVDLGSGDGLIPLTAAALNGRLAPGVSISIRSSSTRRTSARDRPALPTVCTLNIATRSMPSSAMPPW